MELLVPVSAGELLDKITILQIKVQRIDDPAKRANVAVELVALEAVAARAGLGAGGGPIAGQEGLAAATAELGAVNGELWHIEDRIRDCERAGDFGPGFVELARSVYRTNDRRAALKAQINQLCGSQLVEEKSYAAY
ncbi:MAG: hypothetical protein CK536_02665 [Synechococcus sp. Baikal-G1]|nr:MAG: hypothetical protein CK536_02665 [Synechococcus sp. Baikal-G1]